MFTLFCVCLSSLEYSLLQPRSALEEQLRFTSLWKLIISSMLVYTMNGIRFSQLVWLLIWQHRFVSLISDRFCQAWATSIFGTNHFGRWVVTHSRVDYDFHGYLQAVFSGWRPSWGLHEPHYVTLQRVSVHSASPVLLTSIGPLGISWKDLFFRQSSIQPQKRQPQQKPFSTLYSSFFLFLVWPLIWCFAFFESTSVLFCSVHNITCSLCSTLLVHFHHIVFSCQSVIFFVDTLSFFRRGPEIKS